MTRFTSILLILLALYLPAKTQSDFDYSIALEEIVLPGLPGLQSYIYAQHEGKWLIIGGRKDGLHARQPFNAFPQAGNNTMIYVADIASGELWSSTMETLPVSIREQLQSTNMNFSQDSDTLYVIGGYAFAASENDHITFPYLTTLTVSSVIEAVINNESLSPFFKQITNDVFAITGGHLVKMGAYFYLVGGHRFDGRYNPMGNPTYVQSYSNQIRMFTINNSGNQLTYGNYSAITDPVHLRRRDYNLIAQVFPDGTQGYTISSGVFQSGVDLPFLYPVDIRENSYTPITTFNQYLCNYHAANIGLYDSVSQQMHNLFFGGMSQYYYQNGTLIQDNLVPFVKTISRLTRYADGSLQEYQMTEEMPGFQGSGAEFIVNPDLPLNATGSILLHKCQNDTLLLGHIFGGIYSPLLNPFSSNQTSQTSADARIYAVRLIPSSVVGVQKIDGTNPYQLNVFPNPSKGDFMLEVEADASVDIYYYLTNTAGAIIDEGFLNEKNNGKQSKLIRPSISSAQQNLQVTIVAEDRFFVTKKIVIH